MSGTTGALSDRGRRRARGNTPGSQAWLLAASCNHDGRWSGRSEDLTGIAPHATAGQSERRCLDKDMCGADRCSLECASQMEGECAKAGPERREAHQGKMTVVRM